MAKRRYPAADKAGLNESPRPKAGKSETYGEGVNVLVAGLNESPRPKAGKSCHAK